MKKKSIFDELDTIHEQLTKTLADKNAANTERETRLQNARAQLAVIESEEMQTYINGTDAELDELLLKKAALADKIRILEAPLIDNDNTENMKSVSFELLEIDRQSEREAKAELAEHLQAIDSILTTRYKVRTRVTQLNENARQVYKVSGYIPAITALDMNDNGKTLSLYFELLRSRTFQDLLKQKIF